MAEYIDREKVSDIETETEKHCLYNCGVKILIPPKGLIKYNCEDKPKERVSVDVCIADEIERLWRKGKRHKNNRLLLRSWKRIRFY